MGYNSTRANFFRGIKSSHTYITTIETKKYGNIDVLGMYNCRCCEWRLMIYSQKHNAFVSSFSKYQASTPTDSNLKMCVCSEMRNFLKAK
jgi:hypothetical protein